MTMATVIALIKALAGGGGGSGDSGMTVVTFSTTDFSTFTCDKTFQEVAGLMGNLVGVIKVNGVVIGQTTNILPGTLNENDCVTFDFSYVAALNKNDHIISYAVQVLTLLDTDSVVVDNAYCDVSYADN